jgi:LAO/AO transport system kinase
MSKPSKKSALNVQPGVESVQSLNPLLAKKVKRQKRLTKEELIKGILAKDITYLSKAITLIESTRKADKVLAQEVISGCIPHSGNSLRLGITGVPGAGKSTFIESFGKYLIHQHKKKIAVLAIDPSSNKTGGSSLGDKTRMESLSVEKDAFIRPSPSAGTLGGVARKTRESIILCEAAGFDVIIIETVGVGQSETAVKNMVDFFMLLLISGAGDELQGMKRGIMEMADGIWINKADGDNTRKAKMAAADVKRALHLFPADSRGWTIPASTCSALEELGLTEMWESIEEYKTLTEKSGYLNSNRSHQLESWLKEAVEEDVLNSFYDNPKIQKAMDTFKDEVAGLQKSPFQAAEKLLEIYRKGTN